MHEVFVTEIQIQQNSQTEQRARIHTVIQTKFILTSTNTSNALRRSSLVWEADMQMRALAKSRGVAGNATVTTATCKSIFDLSNQRHTRTEMKKNMQLMKIRNFECPYKIWWIQNINMAMQTLKKITRNSHSALDTPEKMQGFLLDCKALWASLVNHYHQEPQNPFSAALTWKSCYFRVFSQVFEPLKWNNIRAKQDCYVSSNPGN